MTQTSFKILGAALGLSLGAASVAMSASQTNSTSTSDGPVRCQISAELKSGMVTLEGLVVSDISTSGAYEFSVKSVGRSGGANIKQGGGFSIGSDDTATLGKVMLGSNGALYDASLKLKANGETITCAERIG